MQRYDNSTDRDRELRSRLFSLFKLKYVTGVPPYNFYEVPVFQGMYEAIESPRDFEDLLHQIRKYFENKFGLVELIDE
jgi:hypothetical protein